MQCRKNRKNLDCPFCREPWNMPNYFIEVNGVNPCTHVDILCHDSAFTLFPIHDDSKVVGMVLLDPELLHGGICLHKSRMKELVRFAGDWKWLFQSVENKKCAFATTLEHTDYMIGQFDKAHVPYEILRSDEEGAVFGTKYMADFIKAAQLLDIGFF